MLHYYLYTWLLRELTTGAMNAAPAAITLGHVLRAGLASFSEDAAKKKLVKVMP